MASTTLQELTESAQQDLVTAVWLKRNRDRVSSYTDDEIRVRFSAALIEVLRYKRLLIGRRVFRSRERGREFRQLLGLDEALRRQGIDEPISGWSAMVDTPAGVDLAR